MHLLTTTSATLDDVAAAVDLAQPPGDIAVLSFADSDLSGLAAAWALEKDALPSVRLAHLGDLRHPMSVDLWIERVGQHAKIIVVRLLGGLDFWRYGAERLAATARERSAKLALLPGEDRDDPRLAEQSTLPADELALLLGFFREGGQENLRALLRRLAHHAGVAIETRAPQAVPRTAGYLPGIGAVDLDRLAASLAPGRPVVPIVFYRAMLLAADTAPIDALCAALAARNLAPAPLVITSLKDEAAADFVRAALARLNPAVVVTTTAFAAGAADGPTPLDGPGAPVLQVVIANTKRAAWRDGARGLGAADLAMHVVLPELDGRVLTGVVAFKDPVTPHDGLAFTALTNRPEPDRVDMAADRIAALVRLQHTPRAQRRIAVLMPDYPGAPGRTGYAVGLDVPASVLALLSDLRAAGYSVDDIPENSRELLEALSSPPPGGGRSASEASREGVTLSLSPEVISPHPAAFGGDPPPPGEGVEPSLSVADYVQLCASLAAEAMARVREAWGDPADDPDVCDGTFRFRARAFGHVTVALAPDRGRATERRADYHDPALPPRHALVAFGLWLRYAAHVDALVHMGAHGTLEWLPGKAVALTAGCFPETITGPLPVIYPFIVSNPGEAAQAKRRIAALTIGHVPPPLTAGDLSGDARELERLVDEFAQADGLDRRRRERLGRLIVEHAQRSGLAREAGVASEAAPDEALRRIDAWLCDLKDLRIKDGLHVYGRAGADADPLWRASAEAERSSILAALDGRRVVPGPAGAPERGRRDVLPTGRNLFTADPRTLPTQTAFDLGRAAAAEVIRAYLQTHGEMPRALVIDLWGSATLRTGGEEIAQGLWLMGCRPAWDLATGRVTGIVVEPAAAVARPRVDVTWRVSGLFRDLFPAQLALIDAAVRAVAARDETDDENPLAAAIRSGGEQTFPRIFSTAPGAYGAGIDDLLGREHDRAALGQAYLDSTSHAYGAAADDGVAAPGKFAARVAGADLLVHPNDDPGRDLLEGAADVSFVGGFAAAAALLGRAPDLVMLDVTDPHRPRARPLDAALARTVRGRAIDPRFIEGQMRHGPRGAAELAETVDRLIAFAETTNAVPSALIDLVHDAYLGDARVRDFLLRENRAAARAIAERLAGARRRGLWHPRRNDVDAALAALLAEAAP